MIRDGHLDVMVTGDLSHCFACGRSWDTNDAYPPPCSAPVPEDRMMMTAKRWGAYFLIWAIFVGGFIFIYFARHH